MKVRKEIWPQTSVDIPDNGRLKLAILSSQYPYKASNTNNFINEVLTKYSSGFRSYENTIVFLVTDGAEYDALKKSIIRLLALRSIKEDRSILKSLSEENRNNLHHKLKKVESSVPLRNCQTCNQTLIR